MRRGCSTPALLNNAIKKERWVRGHLELMQGTPEPAGCENSWGHRTRSESNWHDHLFSSLSLYLVSSETMIPCLTISRIGTNLRHNSLNGRGRRVKIHAYKITPRGKLSLDQVLTHIAALPLTDRLRGTGDSALRLESANRSGQLWTLDFGGLRRDGPGLGSQSEPITDFEMTEDEAFGQETAALFNVETGFMTLQYNHYGPRHSRIQNYFFRFSRKIAGFEEDVAADNDHGFTLSPVVKRDHVELLNRAAIVKNLEVSVYLPGLFQAEGSERASLSSILDNPLTGNAERVRFQVRAPRRRGASLNVTAIRQFVGEMLGHHENVGALEVTIREVEEGPSEPLDFLDARLEMDVPVARVGRRYGKNERWAALREAMDHWAANGHLD